MGAIVPANFLRQYINNIHDGSTNIDKKCTQTSLNGTHGFGVHCTKWNRETWVVVALCYHSGSLQRPLSYQINFTQMSTLGMKIARQRPIQISDAVRLIRKRLQLFLCEYTNTMEVVILMCPANKLRKDSVLWLQIKSDTLYCYRAMSS